MADNDGMIRVLVVEPGEKPYEKEIRNTLEELQKWVDGYIEVVYPFDDQVCIICNEEAKLDGLELNRGLYDDEGNMYDVICGRFIVAGLTEDDFGSLTEEQMNAVEAIQQSFNNDMQEAATARISSITIKIFRSVLFRFPRLFFSGFCTSCFPGITIPAFTAFIYVYSALAFLRHFKETRMLPLSAL